jgi:hypothetical protein
MDTIRPDNSEAIIEMCLKLEKFLDENGLICRRHDVYKDDWYIFRLSDKKDINKKHYMSFLFIHISTIRAYE